MTTQELYGKKHTIRLYGELGVRFGRVHRLAVETTAEAIRALSMLHAGFEAYMMNAKDNGYGFAIFIGKRNITEDQLTFVANNDIRIAPVILGSKNGGIFSIILGVALIAISFLIPASSMFAAGLFNAGLAMALGGVVQLLSPQPKDRKSKDKPENEPSYAFNGPVNTQAQGNCVPVAYGRPWTGSAVISAGIEAGIYIPSKTGNPIAAGILASLGGFWDFDGDLLDSKYPSGQQAFAPYGGGLVTGPDPDFHGGRIGQSVEALSMLKANLLPENQSLSAGDRCVWFWIYVVPLSAITIGLSHQLASSISVGYGMSNNGTVSTAGYFLKDGNSGNLSEPLTVPTGWNFVRLNFYGASKHVECYVNELLQGTTDDGVDFTWVTSHIEIRHSSNNDDLGSPNFVDAMGYFPSRVSTTEEGGYLFTGIDFATLLSDAAGSSSGNGGGGNDEWTESP